MNRIVKISRYIRENSGLGPGLSTQMLTLTALLCMLVAQDANGYLISPKTDATAATKAGRTHLVWSERGQQVEVTKSGSPTSFHGHTVVIKGANEADIEPLNNFLRTYFLLKFASGKHLVVADRFVPLAGADNFRDLGGYATSDGRHTKWGVLYRSNSLHGLTDSDKEALLALGVCEVFDVRGDGEVKKDPDNLPKLTYTRLPIGPEKMMSIRIKPAAGQEFGEAFLSAGYKQIVDDHGKDVYGPWLKSLASQRGAVKPTALHCTAGKDRTGVAYGILLELLGVPRETILADYSLTNITYPSLAKQFDHSGYPASFKSLLIAYPKALAETLDYIDQKYGSMEKYAESSGLTSKEIQVLKHRYLE